LKEQNTFKQAGAPRQNMNLQVSLKKIIVQFEQTSRPNITHSDSRNDANINTK